MYTLPGSSTIHPYSLLLQQNSLLPLLLTPSLILNLKVTPCTGCLQNVYVCELLSTEVNTYENKFFYIMHANIN